MLRILLVDDHPSFRRGVKEILTEGLESVKIGEAGDAQQMLELVRDRKWDLVIMDITLPGRSGLDAVKELKDTSPSLPILVLTMHPEDQYAIRMFKAGVDGYVNKASAPAELVRAIKKVLTGGQYVSTELAEKLALTLKTGTEHSPHERLSDREYQVLCMLASGQTVSDIAKTVNLSVTTVSTYRARILEKMSMKNNAELTRYAVDAGLV
jgi:two-component system, NarL family, invasion response regulator UvrY